MKNTTSFLGKDCVEIEFSGDQTELSVTMVVDQAHNMIIGRGQDPATFGFLVNVTHLGETTTGARRAAANFLRTRPYKRIAVLGSDNFTKYLVKFIVSATGKEALVRYFDKSSEAREWLCP